MPQYLSGAVEGIVDEAVLRRLASHARMKVAHVHVTDGKTRLLARLRGFNEAARHAPWLVLVDLNGDAECAPSFRRRHLVRPAGRMAFRVAVRAIESWVLADRDRVARWLDVRPSLIPAIPDEERDPKASLVALARSSRSGEIRDGLVPPPGSGRKVGPLYVSELIGFVGDERRGWRPVEAARTSASLRRCLAQLRRLSGAVPGRRS